MTILSLTERDTKSYGVKNENDELVIVQNFKNIFDRENNILCVKTSKLFLGKCDATNMLIKFGSLDKSVFSGVIILLKKGAENNKNRYVYVGGNKMYSFQFIDLILEYISDMGENMIPYGIAIGEENLYFPSPHFKLVKRAKIKGDELLKTNGISIDPFDYHLGKHGPDRFENLIEFTCIHSS